MLNSRFLPILLLLTSLFALPCGAADDNMELLRLQHRPASELLPIIRPHLEPGSAVSADGMTLVITGPLQQRTPLRSLATSLDHPPALMWLRLRHGPAPDTDEPQVRVRRTRRDPAGTDELQLLVTSGQALHVSRSQSQLVVDAFYQAGHRAHGNGLSLQRRDQVQSVYLQAERSGDTVLIDLSASFDRDHAPGSELTTRVRARLGAWVQLAGPAAEAQGDTISTRSRDQSGIWLRVDEAGE